MRIARFNHDDTVSYAFVQKDDNDSRDYLVELDGYPLGAQPVSPTGRRFAADGDGIRLLAPVIPSKVYGLAKNYKDPSAAGPPAMPLRSFRLFLPNRQHQ